MAFVELPITTDQATLQDDAFDYVQSKVDGWQLDPAHPMTWLIEACGRMLAVGLFQASLMPSANLRTLAETVYGIPRGDGAPAVASSTWTARDTDGHVIPAGTGVLIDDVPFVVDVPATINPGATSTAAGAVSLTAVDVGTAGNDLSGSAEPVDALTWLDSITIVGTTSGGADAETDEDFQNRASSLFKLQAPRAITAADFEVYTVYTLDGPRPGVARATVIDNLDSTDPLAPVADAEGHITIVPLDELGQDVTAGVEADILADLGAKRVANLVVHVQKPTRTAVTVDYEVTAYEGFDKATLQGSIDEALAAYFDNAQWGIPPYFGDGLAPFMTAKRWVNTPTVRYLQVARVIENVDGVEHIDTLTVNGGTVDVTLPGIAPLPDLQPITTHTVN